MSNAREEALLEQATAALFAGLGWETADCHGETFGSGGTLGRETPGEVVLVRRLRSALERLNPGATAESLSLALDELTRDRGAAGPAENGRDIYRLLKGGFPVPASTAGSAEEGGSLIETVRYLDWEHPDANDFFLASRFSVVGDVDARCCDLVGFVNGIPFVFAGLEASRKDLRAAFDLGLRDCKAAIPRLFWYLGLVILSSGSESRVGSATAGWEHFGEWKRVASEQETPSPSLETTIRGTCEKSRLLDLLENFVLVVEMPGGPEKIVAKNHQYLGVNAALESLRETTSGQGGLGMFWHAPGCGKCVSMIFFAEKAQRKLPGPRTFLVVTDRKELDSQVGQDFVAAGVAEETGTHAGTEEDLGRLLGEQHRYLFAPIQIFSGGSADRPQTPLSDRSDIVVMAYEAHRPRYDAFAANMRGALPNAAFIGFTGTPLADGEERTREVFGDYISTYGFRQGVEDGVTVPLYFENRMPETQLTNAGLGEALEALLEDAEVDAEQEARLEQEFGRQYYLVTDDDRLETVARDIVNHFLGRGHQGKAMVVCIDKATAARMHEKVQLYWALRLAGVRLQTGSPTERGAITDLDERAEAERRIAYLQETDMAVVVSQSEDEISELYKRGIDIVPHRRRMVSERLAAKFKDPADPLRLVFVCTMWTAGFDAACCSTIYLDRPVRCHALMQIAARAGQSLRDKPNGLVVDYVGALRNPEKALAIYGAPSGGGVGPGDLPLAPKGRLVEDLRKALSAVTVFLRGIGFEPDAIRQAPPLPKLRLLDNAVNAVLAGDKRKGDFLALTDRVMLLYRAVLPDPAGSELGAECALFAAMAQRIRALAPEPEIPAAETRALELLREAIEAQGYTMELRAALAATRGTAGGLGETAGVRRLAPEAAGLLGPGPVDLERLDFEVLTRRFPRARKYIEVERLRGAIESRLAEIVRVNRSRLVFREEFEELISEHNEGTLGVDDLFARLLELARSLNSEAKRAGRQKLTEEELALFDLLVQPHLDLSRDDIEQLKRATRQFLAALRGKKLAAGWRTRRRARSVVEQGVENFVERLPPVFTPEMRAEKADLIFGHILDSYYGGGRGVYSGG